MNGGIVALGSAARENDILGLGVDQSGDPGAGFFDVFGDFLAERIGAGSIAPILAQKRNHRIHHFRRYPGRGVIIKVIDFALAHTAADLTLASLAYIYFVYSSIG